MKKKIVAGLVTSAIMLAIIGFVLLIVSLVNHSDKLAIIAMLLCMPVCLCYLIIIIVRFIKFVYNEVLNDMD